MTRYVVCLILFAAARSNGAAFLSGPITAGTADLVATGLSSSSQLASFAVSGQDFSLNGTGIIANSQYFCFVPGTNFPLPIARCEAGSQINPFAGDISNSFGQIAGTVTFGGNTEDYVAPTRSSIFAGETASLDLTAPAALQSSVDVSAPFNGAAFFLDPNFESGAIFTFAGQGMATAHLVLEGNSEVGQYYFLQSIHLEFTTPEPEISVLTGTALAGLGIAWIVRGRRTRRKP